MTSRRHSISSMKCDYRSTGDESFLNESIHQARYAPDRLVWDAELPDDSADDENTWAAVLRRLLPSLSVGKISVLLLLVATVTSSQLPLLSQKSTVNPRSSSILGSAAISSFTETLFPILPFAGGLDLRKEDYWSSRGNWWERLQLVVSQVQDAFAASEDESEEEITLRQAVTISKQKIDYKRTRKQFAHTISAQTPFVRLDTISQMTLDDLTEIFRFALESSRKDFSANRFLYKAQPHVRKVVEAMEKAVERSRGKGVKASILTASTEESPGQIDALKFAAAMRVFAEWRILRQVPEGFKGYAVGMNLGHKDVVQNCVKIESTVHDWIQYQLDLRSLEAQLDGNGSDACCSVDGPSKDDDIRSPSLSELLNYEIQLDVHPTAQLPRLKEKSAAMGLLWVRRQFEYQARLFENILKVPSAFRSSRDAVLAAYNQVYDPYHGWAVQKIFSYSFQAAPEAEVVVRHMNPHRLKEVKQMALRMHGDNIDISTNNEACSESKNDNLFAAFVHHVGSEWDKLARFVSHVFSPNHDTEEDREHASDRDDTTNEVAENFINEEMMRDARAKIAIYLEVVEPVLNDLAGLFQKMNMDDPTKV